MGRTFTLLLLFCPRDMRSNCSARHHNTAKVVTKIANTTPLCFGLSNSAGHYFGIFHLIAHLRFWTCSLAAAVVPVLVITGFLGSGKTTLVRHLLAVSG
jgi:polynucleotide 5'-kinase involved in rRNA processing